MAFEITLHNRKQRVLRVLRNHKDIPKTRIAHMTGLHNYAVEDILEDLEKDSIVEKTTTNGKVYWRLKK